MDHESVTAIQAIQAILAPALGISAVGLLLLMLNARYSTIVNRIRLLNDEKRRYHRLITENVDLSYAENSRYISIRNQTEGLFMRSRLVRNAILLLHLGIALFIIASVMIGMNFFFPAQTLYGMTLLTFMAGLLCVLGGTINAGLEIHRSFEIVEIEVKAEE